ncbi:MAG: hypothetical protein EA001_02800 [Oscillatoriales cyanobacterium]|nr:MAG: hypothetical protein EA001_02800 [Oscillatoriales cyanobacterium]
MSITFWIFSDVISVIFVILNLEHCWAIAPSAAHWRLLCGGHLWSPVAINGNSAGPSLEHQPIADQYVPPEEYST